MKNELQYLYHIYLDGMSLDEGYVGVTCHPNLGKTIHGDRSKPSTKDNVCHYKNMYAVRIE